MIQRAYAEQIGPTVIRFHYPCGHSSSKDYAKGPVARRMGELGVKLMARYWRKDAGGITATCPKCLKTQRN